VCLLQPLHQGLGRRIGIVLKPHENLRPDILEAYFPHISQAISTNIR